MSTDQPNDQPNPGPEPSPIPDRKSVRPPGVLPAEDPSSGPNNADRLTVLAHDLSNMIDGSMRWLGLAIASIPEDELERTDPASRLAAAREQIETVHNTLERMSSMVNAAMRSKTVPIVSPLLGVSSTVTVGMAIDHAIDVVRPLAAAAGVRLTAQIDVGAGEQIAGPLYTVVLNALFNAVQSVERAVVQTPMDPGGLVRVHARLDPNRDEIVIEIIDDGVGLDPDFGSADLFRHGCTSDPTRSGIGLSMCKQIVEQLEGVIELSTRVDRIDKKRPGAVLRVRVPIPEDHSERLIG